MFDTYTTGAATTSTPTITELAAISKEWQARAVEIDEGMRAAVRQVISQGPHALPYLAKHTGLSEEVLQSVALGEGRMPAWIYDALGRLKQLGR